MEREQEERIKDRVKILYNLFEMRTKNLYLKGTRLNLCVLRDCVTSYFYDIKRIKDFHKINFIDGHKQAAFMMLWISRLKPVQIPPHKDIDKTTFLANEIFALTAGISFLDEKIEIEDIYNLSPKYLKNILYTLHYRYFNGMVLSSSMCLLEKLGLKISGYLERRG